MFEVQVSALAKFAFGGEAWQDGSRDSARRETLHQSVRRFPKRRWVEQLRDLDRKPKEADRKQPSDKRFCRIQRAVELTPTPDRSRDEQILAMASQAPCAPVAASCNAFTRPAYLPHLTQITVERLKNIHRQNPVESRPGRRTRRYGAGDHPDYPGCGAVSI
jgi:hypothetical protein